MLQKGTLRLRPLSATLLHNTEHFHKMDPYVIFKLGAEQRKSSVAKRQHLNPVWDEELQMDLTDLSIGVLDIIVKNKELIHDDLIGTGSVNLNTWLSGNKGNNFSEWIPLYYKDKDAGSLLLEMNFTSFNPMPTTQMEQEAPLTGVGSIHAPLTGVGVIQAPLEQQASTTFVQQSQSIQKPLPPVITTESPIIHSETITVREEPVYIQEKPQVFEKEIIREKSIIHQKDIVECTQPIVVEKPELHENVIHEVKNAVVLQDKPISRSETFNVNERPLLGPDAIYQKQTEYQQEAGVFIRERPELYKKDIITEKPIIHEKDIIHIDKPIIVEKPEIVTKEYNLVEAPVYQTEQPLIHQEQRVVSNTEPILEDEPLVHLQESEIIRAAPTFVKERADIYEKQIVHEKPIIHEQSILHTQKEIVHEKPEFHQTRIFHQEAPILKQDPLLQERHLDPTMSTANQSYDSLFGKPRGDQTALP